MEQLPTPGSTPENSTMLKRELNCPPLTGDIGKDQQFELSYGAIAAPTPTEVQHPKPLPTPDEHGVFKSSSDLKKTFGC